MAAPRAPPGRPTGAGFHSRKLVLLGESAVGKSSIVLRFVKNQFDDYRESTIGAAFLTQTVVLPDKNATVKFEIWDTAGQERYRSLAPMYYRNANAALVVFEVTSRETLNKAKWWMGELYSKYTGPKDPQDQSKNVPLEVTLVGNKLDLVEGDDPEKSKYNSKGEVVEPDAKREVKYSEVEATAKEFTSDKLKVSFFEVSAKTGTNVQELFAGLAGRMRLDADSTKRPLAGASRGRVDLEGRGEGPNSQQGQGCQC